MTILGVFIVVAFALVVGGAFISLFMDARRLREAQRRCHQRRVEEHDRRQDEDTKTWPGAVA